MTKKQTNKQQKKKLCDCCLAKPAEQVFRHVFLSKH